MRNAKSYKPLLFLLLTGWCLLFLRCESTEKSMVRAVYLAQSEQGYQAGLLYQAPQAAADAADATAALQFVQAEGQTMERALDAGYEPISILVEKKHVEGEAKQIIKRCGQIPVYTAEFDVLTKITGFKLTRGMLCAMHRRKLPSMREICENAKRIAVLEEVVNPTNIGAIFRSAAAMHMDAVLLTPACSNPLYRRAIRVSMGTVFQIPWTFVDNSVSWPEGGIQLLHKMGFKMAALALSGDSIRIDDPILQKEEKLAILLGTEGDGLTSRTIADCDYTVKIPMSHGVDSLNVAAASAVAFWQLRKEK